MTHEKSLVMACATVIEEMLPLLPQGMQYQVFDFGLHAQPGQLKASLQAAINAVEDQFDTIILGYGLCSQGVVGLSSKHCRLVIPRVDDCIAVFLGSRSAYALESAKEPGTYYLTKGWIEVGDTPFSEYETHIRQYGQDNADYIYDVMMGKYKRLALINTGGHELEKYRAYTQGKAREFKLSYQEIEGSQRLIKKMLFGPWDEEFIVVEPGEVICFEHFHPEDEGVE